MINDIDRGRNHQGNEDINKHTKFARTANVGWFQKNEDNETYSNNGYIAPNGIVIKQISLFSCDPAQYRNPLWFHSNNFSKSLQEIFNKIKKILGTFANRRSFAALNVPNTTSYPGFFSAFYSAYLANSVFGIPLRLSRSLLFLPLPFNDPFIKIIK